MTQILLSCRRLFSLLVLVAVSSTATAQQVAVAPSASFEAIAAAGTLANGGDEIVSQALYVKIRPGVAKGSAPALVRNLAERSGLEIRSTSQLAFSTIELAPDLQNRILSMSPARRAVVEQAEEDLGRIVEVFYGADIHPLVAARLMMKNPEVEYAEPIYLPVSFSPAGIPNDPRIAQQPHLEQIKAFDAWDIWPGDSNTVVGIVDTGVDQDHEDLTGNIAPNSGESGTDGQGNPKQTNGIDDDGNGVVDDWRGANLAAWLDGTNPGVTKNPQHGTAVAGLSSATTNNSIGIAGSGNLCRFFPVKAARIGTGTISEGYNGIMYCARRGFQVVNCSWGGRVFSQAQADMIRNLVAAYDVAIVASAGNEYTYEMRYPSGYRGVIGVAAIDQLNYLNTTWGEHVGVSSPVGMSTIDDNRYEFSAAATSFSAPVASGVLALVRSRYPQLTAEQAIAHFRLTSDTVESANPADVYRLAGYGRINALRAVQEDPFSRPALYIDSVWMTDESGAPRTGFSVGERGLIRVRVRNILGDAVSPSIGLTTYREDSTGLRIGSERLTIPSLASGASVIPEGGIPFEMVAPIADRAKLRFEFSADGGYDDYQYNRLLVYRPYITVTTPKITVSLTDRAQIGYSDFPGQSVGDGFRYEGTPLLYEGGFILSTDAQHVVSNVRGEDPALQQMDFVSVETPTAANQNTVTIIDSAAPESRRIGLEMKVRIVTRPQIENAIGIEMSVKNKSGRTLDSLHVAMFQDWDLSNLDRLTLRESPDDAVGYYGEFTGSTGPMLTSGVADYTGLPFHRALAPIFYAITNNVEPLNLYNGFSQEEKWETVANGIASTDAGPGDVSLVVGTVLKDMRPDQEEVVLFVIGVGPDALWSMQNLAGSFADVDEENSAAALLLGAPRPNPAGEWISMEATRPDRSATLKIHDTYGRVVADLSEHLTAIGAPSVVRFDTGTLPAGIYHIRLTGTNVSTSRSLVVVR